MKKLFAIALALVMVLGIATSAMAISWAAPTVSSSASSPFSAEVVKLSANAGVTGMEYYSIVNDAAAYNYSNVFYAIKLNIPSASQANAAYSGAKYNVGDDIKVTINYTNISGKTSDVKYVKIGASPKTLWYNGKTKVFEESWVPSVSNACGCGDQHVIRDMASGTGEVRVRVCFSASGKLSDIKLAGCYGVAEKEFCGIKPCINCKPQDIKGFLFSGDCAKFKVFFATNAAGKVLGTYVIDDCVGYTETNIYGSMKQLSSAENKQLYGWAVGGPYCGSCSVTGCVGTATEFKLEPLPKGVALTNWSRWTNNNRIGNLSAADVQAIFTGSCGVIGETIVDNNGVKQDVARSVDTYNTVYFKNKDNTFVAINASNVWKIMDDLTLTSNLYHNEKYSAHSDTTEAIAAFTGTYASLNKLNIGTLNAAYPGTANFNANQWLGVDADKIGQSYATKAWSKYKANDVGDRVFYYLETYYFCYESSYEHLFQQISADRIDCDTNDASYLNTVNHLYQLLGFTFADVMAGNVYMTENILLANFGFAIAPCGEATWGAYTAAITVAPIAEVPATGSATFMGFLFIGLSAVATVLNRKRSNVK